MTTMIKTAVIAMALTAGAAATPALADDVRITTFKEDSTFTLNGRTFTIARNQDTTARVPDDYALTSRACPPACIQPMSAGAGVATFGELEVIKFLENIVTEGNGLLIDARPTNDFASGAIPGAVNIPHVTVEETNRYRNDILRALGAQDAPFDSFTFDNAMALVIYADGPWSRDAVHAIKSLLDAGYPPEKLSFYRGGMQSWVQLGLTTVQTQTPG